MQVKPSRKQSGLAKAKGYHDLDPSTSKQPVGPRARSDGSAAEQAFAERLKTERARRGLSQDRLAAHMSKAGYPMHQTAIAKIEKRQRAVTLAEAEQLASIFGLTLEQMLVPVEQAQHQRLAELQAEMDKLRNESQEREMRIVQLMAEYSRVREGVLDDGKRKRRKKA